MVLSFVCLSIFLRSAVEILDVGSRGLGPRGGKLYRRVATTALPIYLFTHFYCRMYRLATMNRVTDRHTEGQTDRQTDIRHYYADRS